MGSQTLKQDPRGNRITMVYDAGNQLVGHRYPDGRRHTFTYDQVGNRTVLADPTGRTTTVYDDRNRPVRVTNPDDKAITYSYDAIGRRRTMTDPDDGLFTYTHDDAGRLHWLENPQGQRTTFTYDGVGRQTQKDLASGTVAEPTYFDSGRLKVLLNSTSTGTIISSFAYAYDPAGNRSSVLESDGTGVAWRYDKTYQLINEARGTPTTTLTWDRLTVDQWAAMTPDEWATMAATLEVDGSVFNTTYTYDPVGNRLVKEESGSPTTYTYDAANELLTEDTNSTVTTYTYDESGNRATKHEPATGATTYAWDADNRLLRAHHPTEGRFTFTYNADGQRVARETEGAERKLIYDARKLLAETDSGGTTTVSYDFSTHDEFGQLLSRRHVGGTDYHQFDALGSTDRLANSSESVSDTYVYTAFGKLHSHTGTSDSPLTFVGQFGYYAESALGLYFLNARYYDPATGQFISRDPIGHRVGINLYEYVRNAPTNYRDPRGTDIYLVGANASGNLLNDAAHQRICVDVWRDCNDPWPSDRRCFSFGWDRFRPQLPIPRCTWLGFDSFNLCVLRGVVYEQEPFEIVVLTVVRRKETTCAEDTEFLEMIETEYLETEAGYSVLRHNCRKFSARLFDIAPGKESTSRRFRTLWAEEMMREYKRQECIRDAQERGLWPPRRCSEW